MNARAITLVIGIVSVAFGVLGLLNPHMVMDGVNLAPLKPTQPAAALGEIRAVYGGMFLVVGVWTVLAGLSPGRYRTSILFIALIWLGVFGGRMLGVYADGDPGLRNWGFGAMELIFGVALLFASWAARGGATPATASPAGTEKPPVLE